MGGTPTETQETSGTGTIPVRDYLVTHLASFVGYLLGTYLTSLFGYLLGLVY